MKLNFLLCLCAFIVPTYLMASPSLNGTPQQYHDADIFTGGNDDWLHFSVGYGIALTSGLVYQKYFKTSNIESMILGISTSLAISVLHELSQGYVGRIDLMTWNTGSIAGGITFLVIHF